MTDRKARAKARAKTTAGLSTPLRFAQDDSIVCNLMKGQGQGQEQGQEQEQEQRQGQEQQQVLRFAQDDNG